MRGQQGLNYAAILHTNEMKYVRIYRDIYIHTYTVAEFNHEKKKTTYD